MKNYIKKFLYIFPSNKANQHTNKTKIIAKDRFHLEQIIKEEIKKNGNFCDLNHIDITNVKDMARLFNYIPEFNGDISKWDTSNVENMFAMFSSSDFNGDISKWNVSQVWNMSDMFNKSKFNGNISDWDVSNVQRMSCLFYKSDFSKDLSNWRPYNLTSCADMFAESQAQAPYWYRYVVSKERVKAIDFYHLQKKISQDYQNLSSELQVESNHKPNKKPKV